MAAIAGPGTGKAKDAGNARRPPRRIPGRAAFKHRRGDFRQPGGQTDACRPWGAAGATTIGTLHAVCLGLQKTEIRQKASAQSKQPGIFQKWRAFPRKPRFTILKSAAQSNQ